MPETETTESEVKTFNWEEVKGHKDSKSSWIVIYDRVYDVTKFLEEVSIFYANVISCDKLVGGVIGILHTCPSSEHLLISS